MLFYKNLESIIFHRHEIFDIDELIVVSGYVGPQPVRRLKELPLSTSVIYGMYGSDSIGEQLHKTLNEINESNKSTTILYSKLPVHSKCYVWRKNKKIVTALLGSANFSVSGLSNPYKEVLAETTRDTFDPLNGYIDTILKNCINYADKSVKLKKRTFTTSMNQADTVDTEAKIVLDMCNVSLLDRYGEVPTASGLNWGRSRGHTTDGDAYIRISIDNISAQPNLFPPKQREGTRLTQDGKATRQNDAVEFIWDDGTVMEGLLEGTQTLNGIVYPKQICSSPKKNILGIYLRKRMGLELKHLITKNDLKKYGRTTIEISLQGEGVYYLDFSV